ncbi:MAG: class I SAM-dependent methyltransferase [Chloroflexi bacterium]|nr:class I SAM-dependent methyltransferase [Chloroflexota bacterium]
MKNWGKIFLGTRLEKSVEARFVQVWSHLITKGLRPGDSFGVVKGQVAHNALNELVRQFLKSDCDTLMSLDSDADVYVDFVNDFRDLEDGWEYDAFQAFYIRRGWPPAPVWLRRNMLGNMTDEFVLTEKTADVDIIGTHCALFRREVFVKALGDNNPDEFDWFYYPRHEKTTEDSAFSRDMREMGFKFGITSKVRAKHIVSLSIGWETYHDYLSFTGRLDLINRYHELAKVIGEFTEEHSDLVIAKSLEGSSNVRDAWNKTSPSTPEQVRAFYGDDDNGYLYDLLSWNCQPIYQRLLDQLKPYSGYKVLVIGAGLGVEAELLADNGNEVDVYDLPGVLRNFCRYRIGDKVGVLTGDTLHDAPITPGTYDIIVAFDVLEHVHPDEFPAFMRRVREVMTDDGTLHHHNNWRQQDSYPMHYDNSAYFAEWVETIRLERLEREAKENEDNLFEQVRKSGACV